MELTPKQQTIELVKNANRILLTTHVGPDGDALGSMLALMLALKKMGKDVMAVCADQPAGNLQYMPGLNDIVYELVGIKDFIISLNLANADVDKLGYKRIPENKILHIVITPTHGEFAPEDVNFSQGMPKFDLIIVLDSADLDRLGAIYDKNTALFYETPIINVDHHVSNDHFGKVNWVDLTATSTAEIMVSLIESLGREKPLIDGDIATCLLTGITTDTGSFQNANTTPKSFTVAAQLVAAGAQQQEIVKHIYKTRPLTTLKLWGKALGRVKEDTETNFIWTTLHKEDFTEIGAEESESSNMIDELLKTAPNINFAMLLSEKKDGVHGTLRAVEKGVDVSRIAQLFGGGGHEAASGFDIPGTTLEQEETNIINKIKELYRK